jgi:Mg/Co/Ni transporter MgtE
MTNKSATVLVTASLVIIVVVGFFAIFNRNAPTGEEATGAIGTVDKYRSEQITPEDVVLEGHSAAGAATLITQWFEEMATPEDVAGLLERSSTQERIDLIGLATQREISDIMNRFDAPDQARFYERASNFERVDMFQRLPQMQRNEMFAAVNKVHKDNWGKVDNIQKAGFLSRCNLADRAKLYGMLGKAEQVAAFERLPQLQQHAFFERVGIPEANFRKANLQGKFDYLQRCNNLERAKNFEQALPLERVQAFERLPQFERNLQFERVNMTQEKFGSMDKFQQGEWLGRALNLQEKAANFQKANQLEKFNTFQRLEAMEKISAFQRANNLEKHAMFQRANNLQKISTFERASNLERYAMLDRLSELSKFQVLQRASHLQRAQALQMGSNAEIADLMGRVDEFQKFLFFERANNFERVDMFERLPQMQRNEMFASINKFSKVSWGKMDNIQKAGFLSRCNLESRAKLYGILGKAEQVAAFERLPQLEQHAFFERTGIPEANFRNANLQGKFDYLQRCNNLERARNFERAQQLEKIAAFERLPQFERNLQFERFNMTQEQFAAMEKVQQGEWLGHVLSLQEKAANFEKTNQLERVNMLARASNFEKSLVFERANQLEMVSMFERLPQMQRLDTFQAAVRMEAMGRAAIPQMGARQQLQMQRASQLQSQ